MMSEPVLARGEGHFGLEPVHGCEDPKVDIIFVHGVAVNPQYAWRYQVENDGKPTGEVINWLKDARMLPNDIKNARILAFNYESQWLRSNNQVRPLSVGQSLMNAIHHERRDGATAKGNDEPKKRPIVFVGHSFGGIVIEHGIANAISDGNPCEDIPRCTVGIALLGTPHYGSDMASFATTLAKITDVAELFGGNASDVSIMEALRMDSTTLHQMINNFQAWVGKYNVDVRCFFETKKTNWGANRGGIAGFVGGRKNELVVTEQSACLQGRPRISLPTNHQKMAKFEGPHSEAYQIVKNQLKEMVEMNLEKGRLRFDPREFKQDNSDIAAVNLECQKALFISWPKTELEQIKRRLGERTPDTCKWLLSKDSYIQWLDGQRPQVMRLVGNPGMGKSMILTFLIEVLTERLGVTPDMVLAYHFCDNRNQSSNTATAVMRQILFQLFQQRPRHFHILQKAYDIAGATLFTDFEKLFEILWEVLQSYPKDFPKGEVFILVDALDECDEKSRKLLLPKLQKIAADSTLEVRLFFTCRPEDDIEEEYPQTDSSIKTLSCHMDVSDIHDDLLLYMKDKIPKLCDKKKWGQTEIDLITETLMEKAKGIFLWCSFVIEDIGNVKRKTEIRRCLQDLPKDLVAVYKRITNAFLPNDRLVAKMVLEIVAGGRRPLKVEELTTTYVLAEDCPVDDKWADNEHPPEDITTGHDDVFKTCGRLLFKDEPTNTINLVHQSAKDYLLSEYLAGESRGIADTNESVELDADTVKKNTKQTNVRLNNLFLELIFRYFSLKDFDHLQYRMVFDAEWSIDWESSWWEMDVSPNFMVYCGREWENHARDAEEHPTKGMGRFINYITYEGEGTLIRGPKTEVPRPRTSVLNSWLRKVAKSGNTGFVDFLLSQGAKRDAADFRGWTAVQLAAKNGRADVIKFLHQKDVDLNAEPPHIDGRTPVQTAAEEGKNDIVQLLVDLGANINHPPAKINGRTALQGAAEKGLGGTVKYLVELMGEHKVNPDVEGAEVSGVTALLAAAGSGGEWQMGKNIHRTIKQRSRLPGSAEIDTQKIAEEDQQDRDQRATEEKNHEEVVRLLVKAKARLIPNQFNWTALHAAVERESDQMVGDMLESFTPDECNIVGDHDGTPLHSAKAKANEDLAKQLEVHGVEDPCTYSKLDLDAMMKYIRAVLTGLMIRSNTERFFFIQSYIPIYHVIYSYSAEGADDEHDKPPVEKNGRRGELVYRDVDAWLKSYIKWNQIFINDTPANNDFLTVYLREWKLFKRGAYYVGRMLRYLTRHWVKHQRDELKHREVHEIADLFFHRWRTGMTSEVRKKIKDGMKQIDDEHLAKIHNDQRVKDAINESLNVTTTGLWRDFKDIFQSAYEYFADFSELKWNEDERFEVELRNLSDEFEIESQVWIKKQEAKTGEELTDNEIAKLKDAKKREVLSDQMPRCWREPGAIDLYLNKLEPLFLAKYSGGHTEEIRQHVNDLWDILRNDETDAQKRKAAENERSAQTNAEIEINGELEADGDVSMMDGPNGIKHAPLGETAA